MKTITVPKNDIELEHLGRYVQFQGVSERKKSRTSVKNIFRGELIATVHRGPASNRNVWVRLEGFKRPILVLSDVIVAVDEAPDAQEAEERRGSAAPEEVEPEDVKLPTQDGLYIPGKNTKMMTLTYVYRLKNGVWSIINDSISDRDPLKSARYAAQYLGGLVRLKAVK